MYVPWNNVSNLVYRCEGSNALSEKTWGIVESVWCWQNLVGAFSLADLQACVGRNFVVCCCKRVRGDWFSSSSTNPLQIDSSTFWNADLNLLLQIDCSTFWNVGLNHQFSLFQTRMSSRLPSPSAFRLASVAQLISHSRVRNITRFRFSRIRNMFPFGWICTWVRTLFLC